MISIGSSFDPRVNSLSGQSSGISTHKSAGIFVSLSTIGVESSVFINKIGSVPLGMIFVGYSATGGSSFSFFEETGILSVQAVDITSP